MAELTITLNRAKLTGRFLIRVAYRADADALPFEHEMKHRHLVQKLFSEIELSEDRNAPVRVEREAAAPEPVGGGGEGGGGYGGGGYGYDPGLPGGDDYDIEIIDL